MIKFKNFMTTDPKNLKSFHTFAALSQAAGMVPS